MILIVDDHLDSCDALRRLLEKVGYKSETVASGEEALGFIRAVKPRLLVLDVMMPDMNGLEVLRSIRMDPYLADIPVMMYTACDNNETVDEALKLGANDYITKSQTDWTDVLGRINEAYEHGYTPKRPRGREASITSNQVKAVIERARHQIERTRELLRNQPHRSRDAGGDQTRQVN